MYHVSTGKTMLTDSKRFETNTQFTKKFPHFFYPFPYSYFSTQLGQASVNPRASSGGTLQAAMPGKLKSPPTSSSSLGGSRWPDPAVTKLQLTPQPTQAGFRLLASLRFPSH